jgi:small subunit ribosomal protein S8e
MNKGRKISGGKYHAERKKKLYEKQGQQRAAILGEPKSKSLRTHGGAVKTILLSTNIVNLLHNKKMAKAKIINVVETPQNRFLSRQNRLMKGAVIETSLGKAKITNRPTQEGQVNAILITESK